MGADYSRCPLRSRRIASQAILGCTARPRLVLQGAQRWPVLRRFNPDSDGLWPRQGRHEKGRGGPRAAVPSSNGPGGGCTPVRAAGGTPLLCMVETVSTTRITLRLQSLPCLAMSSGGLQLLAHVWLLLCTRCMCVYMPRSFARSTSRLGLFRCRPCQSCEGIRCGCISCGLVPMTTGCP